MESEVREKMPQERSRSRKGVEELKCTDGPRTSKWMFFSKTRGIKGCNFAVCLSLGHELTAAQRLKVSATTLIIESSLGAVLGPVSLKEDVTSGDDARYCGGLWSWDASISSLDLDL
ncbi:hypothetical protein BELL_0263g00090 [Botrytis elliptica]|uniref:Uncharacterized protein n=1 Tax=Botrytis elliptica TaxID=278938 RepID=A0A4Z1JMI5_9HELO|nr:hypothetical protein BELL_0263g00090 [Botrytis elliptica]